MNSLVFALMVLAGGFIQPALAAAAPRPIPAPLPEHPGNVFLRGENVVLQVPQAGTGGWRLLDYDDKLLTVADATDGRVALGQLPVGFYRVQRVGESNWVSLAVLAPLQAPTPLESPVALDVAMSWFYPAPQMEAAANLCALAGVNRVRDRLSWGEMEPRKGQWAATNRYDHAALAQSRAGLEVLQVNHSSPSWAGQPSKRFPVDLRDAYVFYQEMARRWQGQVQAFEPWNEADIVEFGGHTGSEMASLQKASYLGLKAGHPGVIACLNVFAAHNRAQLADLRSNEAWPYFDTFNLHHYAPFQEYPQLYADFRAVSAGKPLWVTECALPVKWAGDARLQEPSAADSRLLAERVAKVFACSLHEGSAATFYFLLPHYVEGQTQFGLLRHDLTPRPGYVALAAAGRLLAKARPLGQLAAAPENAHALLFDARPDGQNREVLVAWTTNGEANFSLPLAPAGLCDHLGRDITPATLLHLSSAPLYAILPAGTARQLSLKPPPPAPARLPGDPSPIVLQALWRAERTDLARSAYRFSSEQSEVLPVFVYNLGSSPATGRLTATLPAGWQTSLPKTLELPPQSRTELPLKLDYSQATAAKRTETVRLSGDFGPAGKTVLSVQVQPEGLLLGKTAGRAIAGAADPARWQSMIAGNGQMTLTGQDTAVVVEACPLGSDKWAYPRLVLPAEARPPRQIIGLRCSVTLLEGSAHFRAIFDEENGSSYVADFLTQPKIGQTVDALALFEDAAHGTGWSKPDPNQRLDPDQIISLKIGCNTQSTKVKFSISQVRWLAP